MHRHKLQRADLAVITVRGRISSHSVVETVWMESIDVALQLESRQNVFEANLALITFPLHVADFPVLVELSVAYESLPAMLTDLRSLSRMNSEKIASLKLLLGSIKVCYLK